MVWLCIHNIELDHGCYAISIVYQSMLLFIMSYVKNMVRPDDLGTDTGSLCLRACSGVMLVQPEGGSPRDAGVVTSYTSMVLRYAGCFGCDRAPWFDWGRRQVMKALSVRHNVFVAVSVVPDVRVRCRSSCKEVMALTILGLGPSYHYPIFLAPAALIKVLT